MVNEKPVVSSKGNLSQSDFSSREKFENSHMEIGECSSPTKSPEGKSIHRAFGKSDLVIENSVGSSKRSLSQIDVPSRKRFKGSRMEIGECSSRTRPPEGKNIHRANGKADLVTEKSVGSKGCLSRSDVPSRERFKGSRMEIGECSSNTKPPEGKSIHRADMVIKKSKGSSSGTLSQGDVPSGERFKGSRMEIGECSKHTKPPEGKCIHRIGPSSWASSSRPIREAASVGIPREEMATAVLNSKFASASRRSILFHGNVAEPRVQPVEDQNEDDQDSPKQEKKVEAALNTFWSVFTALKEDDPKGKRFDVKAAKAVKANKKFVYKGKPIIGTVKGIKFGKEYTYRAELSVVGLHRPLRAGIDFVRLGGKRLATSIVASGSYEDEIKNNKAIIYTGHGGNYEIKGKKPYDQKLERGNLALKNSFYLKNLVRFIHRVRNSDGELKYVYKGLFMVTKWSQKRGRNGKLIWEFHLVLIHKG